VLTLAGNLLNLKALQQDPPAQLIDIYNNAEYRRSQQYTRDHIRLDLILDTFNLLILLIFWFCHGFAWLDQIVRGWGYPDIVNGLIYIAILTLSYSLITLPFSIYSTFVIEERYGFNRTTPRVFIMDKIKSMVLAILLGMPLLAGILALFEYGGSYAWLYCWIISTLYLIVMEFIAPTWIMPIFNKFTPLEDGGLKNAIFDYTNSVKYPIQNVYIIDGSRRSSKSNAFFTGFGRNKRIALFDTLIARQSIDEIIAVLAHEIGHYKKGHIILGLFISILHFGLLFFLLSLFINSVDLHRAFFINQPSIYTGIIFFGMLYTPVELFLSLFLNILSRRFEYEADRFATATLNQPGALIEALKKLSADNLSNLTPHPFYVFLHYSHPPLLNRIEAISRNIKTRESPTS
jgi:STE24 endopeptidase